MHALNFLDTISEIISRFCATLSAIGCIIIIMIPNKLELRALLHTRLDFLDTIAGSKNKVQPIADRAAQHLEMISKNFQFCTRRTRILMGFIIYYLVLIVNPMGRILVRWKFFRNNLEILCHPICNWLYYHSNDSKQIRIKGSFAYMP